MLPSPLSQKKKKKVSIFPDVGGVETRSCMAEKSSMPYGGKKLTCVTEEAVTVVSCQHFEDEQRGDPTLESIRGCLLESPRKGK